MIELQPLGAMGSHQQQPPLLAPHIPRPFAEPLHEVGHRGGLFHQFPRQSADAFADQVGPAGLRLGVQDRVRSEMVSSRVRSASRVRMNPCISRMRHRPGSGFSLAMSMGMPKRLGIGAHGFQPPPVAGNHGAAPP
jgi:hypothetical protein